MSYIESVLLGVSFAAIPGPIFFELTRRTLTKGFWHGFLVAGGEFFANVLLLALGLIGVSIFLVYEPVAIALFFLGAAVLFWLGLSAVRITKQDIEESEKKKVDAKNSVFTGFGLAITSPIAIASNVSIGSAFAAQYGSKLVGLTNVLLMASGVILFFLGLAFAVNYARRMLATKYLIMLSRVFGVVLFFFSFYFLYQLWGRLG